MEMKPEDIKKYNLKFPVGTPKIGRFAPHGQFFQCETDEQVAKLEAAGWTGNPFDHGYKPEDAQHVLNWRDVRINGEKKAPAVDEAAALKAELEAARAKIAELEAKPKRKAAA